MHIFVIDVTNITNYCHRCCFNKVCERSNNILVLEIYEVLFLYNCHSNVDKIIIYTK